MSNRWRKRCISAAVCGSGLLLFVALWIIFTGDVDRERPYVTVDWMDSTDHEGNACRAFVISNAGPGAVEWDVGHYQWADLSGSDSVSGAFVMGGSGRLASGEADSLPFFTPTRPEGTWRFVVPCRRADGVLGSLRARLRDRFPRWVPASKATRPVWLVTSPWTEVVDRRSSNKSHCPVSPTDSSTSGIFPIPGAWVLAIPAVPKSVGDPRGIGMVQGKRGVRS